MKKLLKLGLLCMATLAIMISCNQKESKKQTAEKKDLFVLEGTITGAGNAKLSIFNYDLHLRDTVEIVNDKFTITGDYEEPTKLQLSIIGGGFSFNTEVFAENVKMTLESRLATAEEQKTFARPPVKTTGGKFQVFYEKYNTEYKKWNKVFFAEMMKNREMMDHMRDSMLGFMERYIKKNPTNPYPAFEVRSRAFSRDHGGGASGTRLKEIAKLFDPSISSHPMVKSMNDQLEFMMKTEVSLDKFLKGVPNTKYSVDKAYNGTTYKNMRYLAIFKNDNLCTLEGDINVNELFDLKKDAKFNICIINQKGKLLKKFPFNEKGIPSALVVDDKDQIYLMVTDQEVKKTKVRGRVNTRVVSLGVTCHVYDKDGNKLRKFKLDKLVKATGAKIDGNKLMVADSEKRRIGVYNNMTGALESHIDDMRTCCGILDFDVDDKGNLIVANIGSFRVDVFNKAGEKQGSFGQRGNGINEFHGCCNPVNVARLSKGALVTVEKSPTRIKIYSSEGAKTISGIDELVKGCAYIPMVVDSNDNLYLASPEKGLVKCTSL